MLSHQDQRLVAAVDARLKDALTTLSRWCAINSYTRNLDGLQGLGETIVADFPDLAADACWQELPPASDVNAAGVLENRPMAPALVFASPATPAHVPRVLLLAHLDTVYPPEQHVPPRFSTDWKTLYAPGAIDAKGGILVMLAALSAVTAVVPPGRLAWTVVLNGDAEAGSPSSAGFLREQAAPHQLGLVFEPALPDGSLAAARRGAGTYCLVIHGRKAHSGRQPEHGRNAVAALGSVFGELERYLEQASGLSVSLGQVQGGTDAGTVPDLGILRFTARFDDTDIQHRFESFLAVLRDKIARRDGFQAELYGGMTNPPKPLSPSSQFLLGACGDCARDLGFELHWRPTLGASDGNKLAGAGLPVVDTLGVCGDGSHTPDEACRVDSIWERSRMTALLLGRLADGSLRLP